MKKSRTITLGAFIYFSVCLLLAIYFIFAAIRGDFGVLRRVEVDADARAYRAELATVEAEVARMENLTHRLSETYLDLDLLDERARDILGMVRADEIVVP